MRRLYGALTVIFIVTQWSAMAQKTILITDKTDVIKIESDLVSIYEDKSNRLGIQDVSNPDFESKFKQPPTAGARINPVTSTFWMRLKIKADFIESKNWVLEMLDSRHDEVILYSPTGERGKFVQFKEGLIYPFEERHYTHKNFVLDFALLNKQEATYYIKVRSSVPASLICKVRTVYDFTEYAFNEYLLLGMYYGILLIIMIYNFVLFFPTRENIYLFYVFYVFSWAFYSLTDDGLGTQYVWTDNHTVTAIGFTISRPLMIIFFFFYSRTFLQLQDFSKRIERILIIVSGVYILYSMVHGVVKLNWLENILFLTPIIVALYVAIKRFKGGFTPARFFIVGTSFIIVGILLRLLIDTGLHVPENEVFAIILVYSRNIGVILEIITLSWALGERIRFLKRKEADAQVKIIDQLQENERLSQKVNRELEDKVKERTVELEENQQALKEANKQLQDQAEEINKMNLMLDMDNRKLQKNVEEVTQARIQLKDVSFNEFEGIYPKDFAVLRYVSTAKWEHGYICKKCSNNKYCDGAKPFSRRCTKCRYDESPTASTLLHKCKFPLNKALYIIMKVLKHKDSITSVELAKELDLRNGTVWKFKQKVEDMMNEKSQKGDVSEDQLAEILIQT